MLQKFVAVAKQVHKFQVDELARVFLCLHQADVRLVRLFETIVRVGVLVDDEGIESSFAFVFLGSDFGFSFSDFVLDSLETVLEEIAKVIKRLRLLNEASRRSLPNTSLEASRLGNGAH